MKLNSKISVLFLALSAVSSLAVSANAKEFEIDASHSNVGFTVRHLVSRVSGGFNDFSGTINLDEKKPEASSVKFTIKAASINTANEKRDGHLRNEDFFHVEKFPTITFESKKVVKSGKDKGKITGDLTMHGVTKPVTLDVEYFGQAKDPWGNNRAGFAAKTKLNRKDFGIVWNKTLDTGSVMLGEDVDVNLQIEAIEKAPAAK